MGAFFVCFFGTQLFFLLYLLVKVILQMEAKPNENQYFLKIKDKKQMEHTKRTFVFLRLHGIPLYGYIAIY